jgi:hypothetical protein
MVNIIEKLCLLYEYRKNENMIYSLYYKHYYLIPHTKKTYTPMNQKPATRNHILNVDDQMYDLPDNMDIDNTESVVRTNDNTPEIVVISREDCERLRHEFVSDQVMHNHYQFISIYGARKNFGRLSLPRK